MISESRVNLPMDPADFAGFSPSGFSRMAAGLNFSVGVALACSDQIRG
jgi:hypothetical protein